MKRTLTFLITMMTMLCILSVSVFAADTASIQVPATLSYEQAEDVFELLNEYRASQGLNTLVLDQKLTDAAMVRAVETHLLFQHIRPSGKDYRDLIPYRDIIYGENQAMYQSSAASVMAEWKLSSGHNANLLNSKYTHVGIGCAYIDGSYHWIQLFSSKGTDNKNDFSTVATKNVCYSVEVLTENLTPSKVAKDIYLTVGSSTSYTYEAEYIFAGKRISVIPSNFPYNANGIQPYTVYDGSTAIAKMEIPVPNNCEIIITALGPSGSGAIKLYAYQGDPNPVTLNIRVGAHEHQYGEATVLTKATCQTEGKTVKRCTGEGECDARYIYESIPKTEHTVSDTPRYYKEATCTTQGYSGDYYCTVCRQITTEGSRTDFAPHNESDWTIDERNSTDTRILRYKYCLDCRGITASEWIDATPNPSPSQKPDNTPTPGPSPSPAPAKTSFTDVKTDAYYYDAVLWAVEKDVTKGTSKNTFSPDKSCTRAQVVTFLWRANGSPEPSNRNNKFVDVPADAYYRDAVLWAVEKGITTGTSKNTFSPDAICKRGEVVTFLWRSERSPEPCFNLNRFLDVKESDFFYKAVLWAVEQDITEGTSIITFSPNATCTRGQIVTFLYRALEQ